jgi:hypothetical protein
MLVTRPKNPVKASSGDEAPTRGGGQAAGLESLDGSIAAGDGDVKNLESLITKLYFLKTANV